MTCPVPETWIDILSRPSTPPGDVPLAHLAACPSCRAEVAALVRAEIPGETLSPGMRAQVLRVLQASGTPAPSRLWAPAVAAALLLSVGLWAWRSQVQEVPGLPPGRQPEAPVRELPPLPAPGGAWQAQAEVRAVLGRSVAATLEAGARLSWLPEPGLNLALESGRARLDSPGEALSLAVGELGIELQEGEIEVGFEMSAAHASLVLSSAWAESRGEPYVRVLRGSARIRRGDHGVFQALPTGREARPDGADGLSVREAPAVGSDGWRGIEGGTGTLKDGSSRFAFAPSGDYRFEVLVRKRTPTAECALGFAAAGVAYEIPLGSALGSAEGWTRLSVEVSGGWCRVTAGSRGIVSCALAQLSMKAYPSSGPGLRAWGGDLEFKGARGRE